MKKAWNRIEYKRNDIIGNCIYIEELQQDNGNRRVALFKCKCNHVFPARIGDVKNGKIVSCGCNKIQKNKERAIHGLRNHKIYSIWANIKDRCYNSSTSSFKNYGSRGIIMYEEWNKNFKAFYDYVMALPNAMGEGLTIDRRKNNEGYFPGNLRWTNRHIQAVNKRKQYNNTSKYIGVKKHYNNWRSEITVYENCISLGTYQNIHDTANARNNYIIANGLWEYTIQMAIAV